MVRPTKLVWAMIFALMSCAVPGVSRAATKITIMYSATSAYIGSFVAKDQGFFAKRGIDADFVLTTNGSLIVAALMSDSAQVGTPTPTIFVEGADNGLDIVALAATNLFPDNIKSGVVVRAGASIASAQDLVGKKVGVPGIGGLLDVMLRRWMIENKVSPSKVTFVEVGFPQMTDALRGGQVDAVAAVDPFLSRAVGSGAGVFLTDYTRTIPDNEIGSVYASTRAFADGHPDVVRGFQAAILEANAFIAANPDAARESLVRYTKLPPAVIAALPLTRVGDRVTPQQIQFWIDVCREQDLLTGRLDPAKLVVPWQPSP